MHSFHHGGGNDSILMGRTTTEMETSLLEDMLDFVTSLLMLNLRGILLMIIIGVMIEIIVDECHLNIENYVSYVLGIEDKGSNMKKELGNFLKDLRISLPLNPSLMCYEVALVELESCLESYLSYVRIYGDLCAISFYGGIFLVGSNASTCLSSLGFLEESFLHSGSMFDLS
ncbi:hypothetical protein M9H77_17249 [Catharanthus roseus]|uniref:Uncharacterized protein n=1 Tax=Catharanthus roseus TaxID=4058 RepID=A0ACC0B416_CATRO|nr:hypothetical protein M9H77_17249 [Catharanthus roseus]